MTRNGPAAGTILTAVSACPTPPATELPSRAVSRKCIVRSCSTPTQSVVGRNSEKQSTVAGGTGPDGGACGQLPVAAFVRPARIWAMSGNTRVGSVPAAFSPGDGDIRVPESSTIAAVPNWRKSGPVRFVLLTSAVPLPPPMSFCSQV